MTQPMGTLREALERFLDSVESYDDRVVIFKAARGFLLLENGPTSEAVVAANAALEAWPWQPNGGTSKTRSRGEAALVAAWDVDFTISEEAIR